MISIIQDFKKLKTDVLGVVPVNNEEELQVAKRLIHEAADSKPWTKFKYYVRDSKKQ